jgi:hypothetical protein
VVPAGAEALRARRHRPRRGRPDARNGDLDHSVPLDRERLCGEGARQPLLQSLIGRQRDRRTREFQAPLGLGDERNEGLFGGCAAERIRPEADGEGVRPSALQALARADGFEEGDFGRQLDRRGFLELEFELFRLGCLVPRNDAAEFAEALARLSRFLAALAELLRLTLEVGREYFLNGSIERLRRGMVVVEAAAIGPDDLRVVRAIDGGASCLRDRRSLETGRRSSPSGQTRGGSRRMGCS